MSDLPINRELIHKRYDGPRFRFLVLSRSEVKRIAPDEPYIVVSVTNPGLPDAELAPSPLRRDVLRLQFHDMGDYGQPLRDNVLMTDQDAEAILEFVERHTGGVSMIICQCEAGMSRSAGIAAALSQVLQSEDKFFFANFAPNRWIYRTLIEAHEKREHGKAKP
jgi:predicted protein tyrosine phosphatase